MNIPDWRQACKRPVYILLIDNFSDVADMHVSYVKCNSGLGEDETHRKSYFLYITQSDSVLIRVRI